MSIGGQAVNLDDDEAGADYPEDDEEEYEYDEYEEFNSDYDSQTSPSTREKKRVYRPFSEGQVPRFYSSVKYQRVSPYPPLTPPPSRELVPVFPPPLPPHLAPRLEVRNRYRYTDARPYRPTSYYQVTTAIQGDS